MGFGFFFLIYLVVLKDQLFKENREGGRVKIYIKLFLNMLCFQRTRKCVAIDILINAAEVTEVIST